MIVMEGETTKHLKPRAMIVSNSSNSLLQKNLDEDQNAYVHSKSGHQLQWIYELKNTPKNGVDSIVIKHNKNKQ